MDGYGVGTPGDKVTAWLLMILLIIVVIIILSSTNGNGAAAFLGSAI
jgi:hypothetical protein